MRAITLVALLIAAAADAASPDTVIVVSDDTGFVRAVDDAFRASGIEAVHVASEPAIGDPTSESRRLADREHAAASVVLVFGERDATLIAYDRGVDRALVRVLAYRPPLGPRESAEAAHMARTMLHALRVTPELDLPPPHPEAAVEIRARTAAAQLASVEPAASGVLALGVTGGLRLGAPGASVQPDLAAQLVWRPDALGLSATVSLAPSADVETPPFRGTVSDTSAALAARLPIARGSRWQLAGELGLALHRIALTGATPDAPVEVRRFDPALRLAGTASFAVSTALSVGLAAALDSLLIRQDYAIASQRILDVPAAQFTFAVVIAAQIL